MFHSEPNAINSYVRQNVYLNIKYRCHAFYIAVILNVWVRQPTVAINLKNNFSWKYLFDHSILNQTGRKSWAIKNKNIQPTKQTNASWKAMWSSQNTALFPHMASSMTLTFHTFGSEGLCYIVWQIVFCICLEQNEWDNNPCSAIYYNWKRITKAPGTHEKFICFYLFIVRQRSFYMESHGSETWLLPIY